MSPEIDWLRAARVGASSPIQTRDPVSELLGDPRQSSAVPVSTTEAGEHQAQAGLVSLASVDPGLPRHTSAAAYLHEKSGDRPTAARLYAARRAQPG
jgi:hypothetical protein